MLLFGIDHVALNVKNLQNTFDWYSKIFSLKMIKQWQSTWMFGDEHIRIGAFLRPDAKTLTPDDIEQNFIVIQHFAFGTNQDGLKKAIDEIDSLGIPRSGSRGFWYRKIYLFVRP